MSITGTEVPRTRTKPETKEFLAAIALAFKAQTHRSPSRKQLSLVWGQWALETGRGKACYNHNLGNIRGTSPESKKYFLLPGAYEIINGEKVITGGSFRAYDDFEEGARDYIAVIAGKLRGGNDGWKALTATEDPDAKSFIQGLKDDKYFTADVVAYSASVDSLSRECLKKIPESDWPADTDDDTGTTETPQTRDSPDTEEEVAHDWNDWSEIVDKSRRYETTKKGKRPASITKPTHIVVHITGTENLASVKNAFLTEERSAHYLVDREGNIHQFVPDSGRAWHAGIKASLAALYKKNDGSWRNYTFYYSWYKYPAGIKYFDGEANPLPDAKGAVLVGPSAGGAWSYYDYFDKRWGDLKQPFNFDKNVDPNNYAIGIELLSVGNAKPGLPHYPEALYRGLERLLRNLCKKYKIPRDRQHIIGHEDVDPCARWGWDPHQGFDWERVLRPDEGEEAVEEPADEDHGPPVRFDLVSMTEDQRYEHLKGVWKRAQERFGHEGDKAYDFQEENGRINLIGARGLLVDTLQPVANTREAWDDTMFVVHKDAKGKKRVRAFRFSTEPNDPKGKSHTSTLVVGMHEYKLGTHHNGKACTRVRISKAGGYPGKKGQYRALNPLHAVTFLDNDGNITEDPGEHFGHDAAINMHYGGDAATSTWSHGCQVFKGWSEYVDFIELCESDSSLRGSSDNDLAPRPAKDGARSIIYLLIEGNLLRPPGGNLLLPGMSAADHFGLNEKGAGGYFPIGANNFWHGGSHFDIESPVTAVADGEVVAYRATRKPLEVELGGAKMPLSNDFVLIRHQRKTPKGQEIQFFSLYMHLLPLGAYTEAQKAAAPSPLKKRAFVVATQEDGKGLNVRDGTTGKTVLGVIPMDTHFDVTPDSVASWNASYKAVDYEGLKGFALVDKKRAEKVADSKYRCLTREDKPADTGKLGLAVRETGSGSRVVEILPKGTKLDFKSPNEIAPGGQLAVGWHELADGGWVYVRAGQNPTITASSTIEPEAFDKVVQTRLPITAGAIVGHTGPYLVRERTVHFEIIARDVDFMANPKSDEGGSSVLLIPAGTTFRKRTKPKAETITVNFPAGARLSLVGRDRTYRKVALKDKTGWATLESLGKWDDDADVFVLASALPTLLKVPPPDTFDFKEDAGKSAEAIEHPVPATGSPAISSDKDGHPWYEVEYDPGQKGWLDPDQPGLEKKCVYDWPGWQKIEEHDKFSDDGLCDAAEIVSMLDVDGDAAVSTSELKQALAKPAIAQKLRKIACAHPTEWAGEIKGIERLAEPPWGLDKAAIDTTREYIKKLGFWDDAKDAGLPPKDKAWNLHPIGFLEHLRTLDRTAQTTAVCGALQISVWKQWKEEARSRSNTNVIQLVPESMLKDAKHSLDVGKARDMVKDWKRLGWKEFVKKHRKDKTAEKPQSSGPETNIEFAFSKAAGSLDLNAALQSTVECPNTVAHTLVMTGPDGKQVDLVAKGGELQVAYSGSDSDVDTVVPRRYFIAGKACDGSSAGVTIEVFPASFFLFEYSIEEAGEVWKKLVDRLNKLLDHVKSKVKVEISLAFSGGVAGFFGWRDDDEEWRAYYVYEIAGKGGVELGLEVKFSFVDYFTGGMIPESFKKYAPDVGVTFGITGGVSLELKAEIRRFPRGATRVGWKPVVSLSLKITVMVSFGLYAKADCWVFTVEVVGKVECGVSGGGTLAWKNNQLALTPEAALEPGEITVTLTLKSGLNKHENDWKWQLWPKKDLLKNADAWVIYDPSKKSKT